MSNIARFISSGIRGGRTFEPEIPADDSSRQRWKRDVPPTTEFIRIWSVGEDFDYIGLSYYPSGVAPADMLEDNMNDMATVSGKELIITVWDIPWKITTV